MKKLVRDKIPDIMEKQGEEYSLYIADAYEYKLALREKLKEEVAEFLADNKPEELADILEVIHALADSEYEGYDRVEQLRKKKANERGGFSKQIIMTVK